MVGSKLRRESTGNVQKALFIDKMKEILVPVLPQEQIAKEMQKATSLILEAENCLEKKTTIIIHETMRFAT